MHLDDFPNLMYHDEMHTCTNTHTHTHLKSMLVVLNIFRTLAIKKKEHEIQTQGISVRTKRLL